MTHIISKNISISLLMSHLASSEQKTNNYNKKQKKIFDSIQNRFSKSKYKSLANSMGIILGSDYHYDLVRPGIAIYGGHYNTFLKNKIKPVIKLKAEIKD